MGIGLSIDEKIARLRSDLRMGAGVALCFEGAYSLVFAAETVSSERLAAAREMGAGLVLAITSRRAETLRAPAYDGDVARIQIPDDVDLRWIQAIADPSDDLIVPMKGPCISLREGSAEAHRAAIELCKQARLLPAAIVVPVSRDVVEKNDLSCLDLSEVDLKVSSPLHEVTRANLPLEVSDQARLHVFRPEDGGEEHYAIEIGRPSREAPVLTRLHSACFTGDLLGSLKCDCGPQLRAALRQIGEEKQGVLLYLNQEGRGIGLANKMRAYSLQDQGFDTVEANHRLGFEDDERDFKIGAEILKSLGFSDVRLLTNNPRKVAMLEAAGIGVAQRVPLVVGESAHNKAYLATKAKKSGHFL